MPVTLVKSGWRSANLVFEQVTSGGAIHYGINGTGLDVKFWGDTASVYALWDESANNLDFVGEAHIDMTDQATMLIFKDGATSTKAPATNSPGGWLNAHVTAISTTVYIPWYVV